MDRATRQDSATKTCVYNKLNRSLRTLDRKVYNKLDRALDRIVPQRRVFTTNRIGHWAGTSGTNWIEDMDREMSQRRVFTTDWIGYLTGTFTTNWIGHKTGKCHKGACLQQSR